MNKYMKTLIFCFFLSPLLLQAQQPTLHGVITILNSRFDKGKTEYVQDAEIQEVSGTGSVAVPSGADGRFRIDLTGHPKNEPVFMKVSKAGYWLVNDANLQILPGGKDAVHLFLATGPYLAAARQRYYDNAYTAAQNNLLRLYDVKKKTLVALQDQAGAAPAPIKSLQEDISGLLRYFETLWPPTLL